MTIYERYEKMTSYEESANSAAAWKGSTKEDETRIIEGLATQIRAKNVALEMLAQISEAGKSKLESLDLDDAKFITPMRQFLATEKVLAEMK